MDLASDDPRWDDEPDQKNPTNGMSPVWMMKAVSSAMKAILDDYAELPSPRDVKDYCYPVQLLCWKSRNPVKCAKRVQLVRFLHASLRDDDPKPTTCIINDGETMIQCILSKQCLQRFRERSDANIETKRTLTSMWGGIFNLLEYQLQFHMASRTECVPHFIIERFEFFGGDQIATHGNPKLAGESSELIAVCRQLIRKCEDQLIQFKLAPASDIEDDTFSGDQITIEQLTQMENHYISNAVPTLNQGAGNHIGGNEHASDLGDLTNDSDDSEPNDHYDQSQLSQPEALSVLSQEQPAYSQEHYHCSDAELHSQGSRDEMYGDKDEFGKDESRLSGYDDLVGMATQAPTENRILSQGTMVSQAADRPIVEGLDNGIADEESDDDLYTQQRPPEPISDADSEPMEAEEEPSSTPGSSKRAPQIQQALEKDATLCMPQHVTSMNNLSPMKSPHTKPEEVNSAPFSQSRSKSVDATPKPSNSLVTTPKPSAAHVNFQELDPAEWKKYQSLSDRDCRISETQQKILNTIPFVFAPGQSSTSPVQSPYLKRSDPHSVRKKENISTPDIYSSSQRLEAVNEFNATPRPVLLRATTTPLGSLGFRNQPELSKANTISAASLGYAGASSNFHSMHSGIPIPIRATPRKLLEKPIVANIEELCLAEKGPTSSLNKSSGPLADRQEEDIRMEEIPVSDLLRRSIGQSQHSSDNDRDRSTSKASSGQSLRSAEPNEKVSQSTGVSTDNTTSTILLPPFMSPPRPTTPSSSQNPIQTLPTSPQRLHSRAAPRRTASVIIEGIADTMGCSSTSENEYIDDALQKALSPRRASRSMSVSSQRESASPVSRRTSTAFDDAARRTGGRSVLEVRTGTRTGASMTDPKLPVLVEPAQDSPARLSTSETELGSIGTRDDVNAEIDARLVVGSVPTQYLSPEPETSEISESQNATRDEAPAVAPQNPQTESAEPEPLPKDADGGARVDRSAEMEIDAFEMMMSQHCEDRYEADSASDGEANEERSVVRNNNSHSIDDESSSESDETSSESKVDEIELPLKSRSPADNFVQDSVGTNREGDLHSLVDGNEANHEQNPTLTSFADDAHTERNRAGSSYEPPMLVSEKGTPYVDADQNIVRDSLSLSSPPRQVDKDESDHHLSDKHNLPPYQTGVSSSSTDAIPSSPMSALEEHAAWESEHPGHREEQQPEPPGSAIQMVSLESVYRQDQQSAPYATALTTLATFESLFEQQIGGDLTDSAILPPTNNHIVVDDSHPPFISDDGKLVEFVSVSFSATGQEEPGGQEEAGGPPSCMMPEPPLSQLVGDVASADSVADTDVPIMNLKRAQCQQKYRSHQSNESPATPNIVPDSTSDNGRVDKNSKLNMFNDFDGDMSREHEPVQSLAEDFSKPERSTNLTADTHAASRQASQISSVGDSNDILDVLHRERQGYSQGIEPRLVEEPSSSNEEAFRCGEPDSTLSGQQVTSAFDQPNAFFVPDSAERNQAHWLSDTQVARNVVLVRRELVEDSVASQFIVDEESVIYSTNLNVIREFPTYRRRSCSPIREAVRDSQSPPPSDGLVRLTSTARQFVSGQPLTNDGAKVKPTANHDHQPSPPDEEPTKHLAETRHGNLPAKDFSRNFVLDKLPTDQLLKPHQNDGFKMLQTNPKNIRDPLWHVQLSKSQSTEELPNKRQRVLPVAVSSSQSSFASVHSPHDGEGASPAISSGGSILQHQNASHQATPNGVTALLAVKLPETTVQTKNMSGGSKGGISSNQIPTPARTDLTLSAVTKKLEERAATPNMQSTTNPSTSATFQEASKKRKLPASFKGTGKTYVPPATVQPRKEHNQRRGGWIIQKTDSTKSDSTAALPKAAFQDDVLQKSATGQRFQQQRSDGGSTSSGPANANKKTATAGQIAKLTDRTAEVKKMNDVASTQALEHNGLPARTTAELKRKRSDLLSPDHKRARVEMETSSDNAEHQPKASAAGNSKATQGLAGKSEPAVQIAKAKDQARGSPIGQADEQTLKSLLGLEPSLGLAIRNILKMK
ncbi:hypothetical protein BJ742DRAFT_902608 [Cladochytrium replicatum]|nr:hypothetical protein BJ742DRAFT_902608 [Cladochytrium replicatum]